MATTTKRPRTVLDVELMTDRQLLRELEKIHAGILDRLDAAYEMGKESPEAVEHGVLLLYKVDKLISCYEYGTPRTVPGFNWDADDFQRAFNKLLVGCVSEEAEV